MFNINEYLKARADAVRELQSKFIPSAEGLLIRDDECSISRIVEMVKAGQPVNGIEKAFPDFDDEEGCADDDRDDYKKLDELEGRFSYFDDDLLAASALAEKDRAEAAAALAKQTPPQETPPQETPPQEQTPPQETPPQEQTPPVK